MVDEKLHLDDLKSLASGITHEINTPLTYIKGSFEMMKYDIEALEESKLKNDIMSNFSSIEYGLIRIENIISSMREIFEQSATSTERVNLYSTIITSAVLAYNKIKHTSNIYINKELFNLDMDKNKYCYMVNMQTQRVEQVWIIIINNAMDELIKINNFDDRRLDIDISSDDKYVTVIFKDNAGGISEDIQDRLFDLFKGNKSFSGLGVGLGIAKHIIDDQDGATIEAYNEDNGAVFKVQFPLA